MERNFQSSFAPNVVQGLVSIAELVNQLSLHLANVSEVIRHFMEDMTKLSVGCCQADAGREQSPEKDEVDGTKPDDNN